MLDGERLDLLLRRLDELRSTMQIRTCALSDAFDVGATRGWPAEFSVSVPDEDDFRSFVLCSHDLVAKKERASLDEVANTLLHRLEAERLREFIVELRETWRRERKHGATRLVIDGRGYGSERMLDLNLNGPFFDSDDAKVSQLDSVGAVGLRLTIQKLNGMLVAGVNYASALRWALLTARSEGLLHC